MKRFWSFALLLSSFALLIPQLAFAAAPDVPGRGYDPTTEPCGFVMGRSVTRTATAYSAGFVNADVVSNSDQACVDASGFFYENDAGRNSSLMHSKWGYMDFVWSANPSENVRIDPLTGKWYGRAHLNQLASKLRPVPMQDNKLQFDWTCHGEPWCDPALLDTYRVHTDLSTGAISGVAWNTHTGYVDFGGLSMELPPLEIRAFVDVYANGTQVIPQTADLSNAPLADGYQSWRASVKFFDVRAQRTLTSTEVTGLNLTATVDSNVTIDQVANRGAATFLQTKNPALPGCTTLTGTAGCLMTELDGNKSWNTFIYSVAPTSNMLGVADASGQNLAYPADRFGGIGFYPDDPLTEKTRCRADCNGAKEDVFYARSTERNRVSVEDVQVSGIQFSPTYLGGRTYTLDWGTGSALNGTAFTYGVPENEQELKFRPNYRTQQFDLTWGGRVSKKIPDDTEARGTVVPLNVDADWTYLSPESIAAGRTQRTNYYMVNTRADEDVASGGSSYTDSHFVFKGASLNDTNTWISSRWGDIPSDDPVLTYTNFQCLELHTEPFEEPDPTWQDPLPGGLRRPSDHAERRDMIAADFGVEDDSCPPGYTYTMGDCLNDAGQVCTWDEEYVTPDVTINPGRPYTLVSTGVTQPTYTQRSELYFVEPVVTETSRDTNDLRDMTLEQYVCEPIDATLQTRFGLDTAATPSVCYYTAYLSIKGNKTDPRPLKVTGTVDRQTGSSSNLAILGSSDLPKLRNELYAKVARYALGQSAAGGDLSLDAVAGGGVKELLDGRLLLAQGDVTIDGSDGFSDTTLAVLNGDVFIHGDVTGGRLQILVFGGNVYIDPSVKELNVNMFTDGSVFSDSGHYDENGVPVWGLGDRTETLVNQLLITGSVLSCNSIDGAQNPEDGQYDLGCGEKTSDYAVALEHDLASLREFRLCYILDEFGNPTDEITSCGDTPAQALAGFPIDDPENVDWAFSTHVKHESPSSRQLDFGIF